LHGDPHEEVYMEVPEGVVPPKPDPHEEVYMMLKRFVQSSLDLITCSELRILVN